MGVSKICNNAPSSSLNQHPFIFILQIHVDANTKLKGSSTTKILRLNIIFLTVMECGIAHFGRT